MQPLMESPDYLAVLEAGSEEDLRREQERKAAFESQSENIPFPLDVMGNTIKTHKVIVINADDDNCDGIICRTWRDVLTALDTFGYADLVRYTLDDRMFHSDLPKITMTVADYQKPLWCNWEDIPEYGGRYA
jgi:hypothetical protein